VGQEGGTGRGNNQSVSFIDHREVTVATPTDPDGEFLTPIMTMEDRLRDAQRTLLGVHAPFSEIVAHPDRFDPAGIARIRVLIDQLDAAIRKESNLIPSSSGWGQFGG